MAKRNANEPKRPKPKLDSTQLSAELDFYLFWIIYECLRPNQFSTAKAKSFASPKKKDPTTYGQSMGPFESRQSSPNHESQFAIAKEPQNKHTAEPPTHTPNELQLPLAPLYSRSASLFVFLSLWSQFGQRVRRQRRQRCYCCPLPRKCDK